MSIGLVDYLGGLSSAVMIAKQMAGISLCPAQASLLALALQEVSHVIHGYQVLFVFAGQDELVRVKEVLTSGDSPLALLRGAVMMALSSLEVTIVAGFAF